MDLAENTDLENSLRKSGLETPQEEAADETIYAPYKDTKILVSKKAGKLWHQRIQDGLNGRKVVEDCWSEAIRYYENDQMVHRGSTGFNAAGNKRFRGNLTDQWSETENVVFANACVMLPMLYAKNPAVEITPSNEAHRDFADACEKLINTLFNKKSAPGINIKNKIRRIILWTLLTNGGYSKIGWTSKDEANQAVLAELQELTEEYGKAECASEIKEIEAKLQVLDEKLNLLTPAGPTFKVVSPFRLVIDPTSNEPDHSDANWIAEWDMLPTDYINVVFGKEQDEKIVSRYEPTHVLKAGEHASDIEDLSANFSLFSKGGEEETARNYGYQSSYVFKKSCYTKVWWIWDKTTRRLFLYADNKFEWPLWVWDDPLKTEDFYPYKHLWFHEQVEGSQPKGEVTYILDQQDAINDINSTISQGRNWAKMNVFYDKNRINQSDVEAVLKGPDGTARGIDVPEGGSLKDVIFSMVPPAFGYTDFLNADSKFAAINRIVGINDAQRGAQFKTNTTNEAINFYQHNVEIRVDEKVDQIEDFIGAVAWDLLQLCVREMSPEDVRALIGDAHAAAWMQISDPRELQRKINLRIVGGSTDKPTSRSKKENALKIGQVLGQFASGVPALGIIAVKVIARAFEDDVNLTKEDLAELQKSMEATANKAGAGPGGAPSNDPAAAGGGQEEQIRALVQSLPPEAKQELEQLIQQGVPPTKALQQVMPDQQPA